MMTGTPSGKVRRQRAAWKANSEALSGEISAPSDFKQVSHVSHELQWAHEGFRLLTELGQGAFGSVCKARHEPSGALMAVKRIHASAAAEAEEVRREIDVLKRCTHENIVCYYGTTWSRSQLWILMEYCDVGSVSDLLDVCGRRLREHEIAEVMRCTCAALVYLHGMNIMHRDVKGANILLCSTGAVKLGDFGVAEALGRSTELAGSAYWMAPEVANAWGANEYGCVADVWSMGITLWEMCCGVPPHWNALPMAAIRLVRSSDAPRLPADRASDRMRSFAHACLTKDASGRPSAALLSRMPFVRDSKGPAALAELILETQLRRIGMHNHEKPIEEDEEEEEEEGDEEEEEEEEEEGDEEGKGEGGREGNASHGQQQQGTGSAKEDEDVGGDDVAVLDEDTIGPHAEARPRGHNTEPVSFSRMSRYPVAPHGVDVGEGEEEHVVRVPDGKGGAMRIHVRDAFVWSHDDAPHDPEHRAPYVVPPEGAVLSFSAAPAPASARSQPLPRVAPPLAHVPSSSPLVISSRSASPPPSAAYVATRTPAAASPCAPVSASPASSSLRGGGMWASLRGPPDAPPAPRDPSPSRARPPRRDPSALVSPLAYEDAAQEATPLIQRRSVNAGTSSHGEHAQQCCCCIS